MSNNTNLLHETELHLYKQIQERIYRPIYLYLVPPRSSMIIDSVELSKNIIADIDKNSEIVGIEILPLSKQKN